jgi:hypothetical protein
MGKKLKVPVLVLGIALLLGILGVGVASAAGPNPPPPMDQNDAVMGKVARILGIEQQSLLDAFQQARVEMIDEAVQAGQITREQADQMTQRMQQGDGGRGDPRMGPPPMVGPGMGGPGMGGPGPGGRGGMFPPPPQPTPADQ